MSQTIPNDRKFVCIKAFVTDISDFFSNDIHSLALYDRLLSKTTLAHIDAIAKHITSFSKFCTENRDVITSMKGTFKGTIEFSAKVFIDMNTVMGMEMSSVTRSTIWSHLLTLSAILDPLSNAKEILKAENLALTTSASTPTSAEPEDDFLSEVMAKVEKAVDPNSTNPSAEISKIMSSGIVNDLVESIGSKVSSGNLDIGKMFGSVQKMLNTMSPDAAGDPQLTQTMNMITGMMGMMGKRN